MFGRVHQHHAVLVEQALVAFHHDYKIALVLEGNPGAAVGQYISVTRSRGIERRAHALPDRFVPGPLVLIDVDAGILVPESEFGDVSAGSIAARDERRLL